MSVGTLAGVLGGTQGLVEAVQRGFALSLPELSDAVQIPETDLRNWRYGDDQIPDDARALLLVWIAFHNDLLDVFGSERAALLWLSRELPYLEGRTPRSFLVEGKLARAKAAFEALASGIFI